MTAETPPTWRGQYLGWICLAALVFFNVLPRAYVQMVNFPYILVWQIGFLCLGIWGIWMLRQFNVPFQPLGYGLDWGVGLILLALILSVSFADFKEVAAYNFSMALGYGVLLYTLRNWFALAPLSKGGWGDLDAAQVDQKGITWQKVWQGLCVLGSIIGIISLILWLISCFQEEGFEFVRNTYPLGNANFTTSYFVLILPLVFSYSLSVQGWQRWLGLFFSAELLFVFYTTGSRGGLLGFITLLIAGSILVVLRAKQQQRRNLILIFASLILVSLVLLITNPKVQDLWEKNVSADEVATTQLQLNDSILSRVRMWQAGFDIFQDHPLLGVGIGNMSRVYNLYRPIETGGGGYTLQQLHNTPIQILAETGIIGVTAVITFLYFIIRLWFRLYRHLADMQARYLLYGIGGGLLAYSGSVLTDYQLENIGISGTITVACALLLRLADQCSLEESATLSIPWRRGISLVSVAFLSLACLASFPLTVAMGIHQQAEGFLRDNDLGSAVERIETASEIVPWTPVYPAHLGKIFLNLREKFNEGEQREQFEEFSEFATQYFQQSIEAAPNDQWFHHNLGMALLPLNPKNAREAFTQVVELLPRGNFYDYYLLALTYLETNQPREKIITTLALQGLVQPEFLTFPVWETNQQLSELREAVWDKTLGYLEELQTRLSPNTEVYEQIYESRILLNWWQNNPLPEIEISRLRPVIQALLIAETSSEEALRIVQTALEETPESISLLFLQAWLAPDQYLQPYLAESELFREEDATAIQADMQRFDEPRDLLRWLESRSMISSSITGLIYTYRNYDVVFINTIFPPELNFYPLSRKVGLFPEYPQHLVPLDELVQELKAEVL